MLTNVVECLKQKFKHVCYTHQNGSDVYFRASHVDKTITSPI